VGQAEEEIIVTDRDSMNDDDNVINDKEWILTTPVTAIDNEKQTRGKNNSIEEKPNDTNIIDNYMDWLSF
jgi:hypothetical protein